MGKTFVYAGNWTVQAADRLSGIGIYEYEESDGSLRYIGTVRQDITAGMIEIDEKRGVLYAIDEQQNSPAFAMQGGGGRVIAFSIDGESGLLTELGNEQPTFGTLPTYVAMDPSGKWLVVVNHGDKQAITKTVRAEDGAYRVTTDFSEVTAVLYPLAEDGGILPACDVMKFEPDRSFLPVHIACLHSAYFAQDGEHVIISNMKQDQLHMLRLNKEKGRLEMCDTLECPEGNWPRYGAFHPQKRLFYFNNERALIVNTLRYDENGRMELLQTLDSTPELPVVEEGKRISQSDIRISRDGKYIYDFYRYTDCVTVFAVDEKSGLLHMIQSLELTEKRPRGFGISPDGRFLLVANLTGSITTMAIGEDGRLTETGIADRNMSYPGNITFYQPK